FFRVLTIRRHAIGVPVGTQPRHAVANRLQQVFARKLRRRLRQPRRSLKRQAIQKGGPERPPDLFDRSGTLFIALMAAMAFEMPEQPLALVKGGRRMTARALRSA